LAEDPVVEEYDTKQRKGFHQGPFRAFLGCRLPGVDTPGFYEADYVKIRVKHFFSLSLVSFIPNLATTLFPGFGV
jgi:hypothetical protein